MPNRPGRPSGGPPMAQRLAQYLVLRTRGLTYDEAAEVMNVSRAAICQYARRLRDADQLPPVPRAAPKPPPPPKVRSRCRGAVLEHLRSWPDSWFSEWDLRRVGINAGPVVLDQLAAEGVVEVVDGMRYPSDRKVPARRYRLAAAPVSLGQQETPDAGEHSRTLVNSPERSRTEVNGNG